MTITSKSMTLFSRKGLELHKALKASGKYGAQNRYPVVLQDGNITYGEGYPITGIEKFLGYHDPATNIAYCPSISMTTDFSVAKAFCRFVKQEGADAVILDGNSDEKYKKRMSKALANFRRINDIKGSFQFYITREKRYGEAKGLGESAAVAAAVSRALIANVFGSNAAKDSRFVSRYARFVSGSGTRSAAGGVSLWLSYPNINEEECYAERMDVDYSKLYFFACLEKSTVETINAHTAALQSDFYSLWMRGKYGRIAEVIRSGITVELLELLAENEMFRLDSILMSSGVFIHNENSMKRISAAIKLRDEGIDIHVTADTGPTTIFMSTNNSDLKEAAAVLGCNPLYGSVKEEPGTTASKNDKTAAHEYFAEQDSLRHV